MPIHVPLPTSSIKTTLASSDDSRCDCHFARRLFNAEAANTDIANVDIARADTAVDTAAALR